MAELTIDELMAARAAEDLDAQLAQEDATPRGKYEFKAMTVEGRRGEKEEIASTYGRGYLHFFGSISQDGTRRGSIGFDASWESRKTVAGRIDGMTRRWRDITKALDLPGDASASDVLDAAKAYPVVIEVELGYGKDGEKLAFPKTEEEVASLLADGYMPRNWVRSISKVK